MDTLFRLWLCIFLGALGVTVGFVLCITGPIDRRLEANRERRVLNDRHHARSWLATGAETEQERLAVQAEAPALLKAVQQAHSEPADDPHAQLGALLREIGARLGGDLLLLDDKGRLLGRSGLLDPALAEKLGGTPFQPTQMVVIGNKLYRLTTIALADHSTLLHAEEFNVAAARRLRTELDSEVAFVSRHQVYASSAEAEATELTESAEENGQEVRERTLHNQQYLVTGFPLVEGTDLACLLFAGRGAPGSLWGLVGELQSKDILENSTSLLAWLLGWAGIVALGLVALRRSYDRPIAELIRETQNLARGGALRLRDNEGAQFLRPLERAFNAAIERVVLAEKMAEKRQATREDTSVRLTDSDGLAAAEVLRGADESVTAFVAAEGARRTRKATEQGLIPMAQNAQAVHANGVPKEITAPPILRSQAGTALPSESFVPPPQVAEHLTESDAGSRIELGGNPQALAVANEDRKVFDEFVSAKERCGESTEGVTFDRFVAKLEANRQLIASSHGCRTVRFRVFVKDGKAALKAIPMR